MKQPSFLARRPLGPPNYLLIALAAAFVLGLVPLGFWKALGRVQNQAESWLPGRYDESRDLAWFDAQFPGDQFIVVSWDGCTLGNDEQLRSLARRLRPGGEAAEGRSRFFTRVVTGSELIDQLMKPPAELGRREAIERLEGFLVGPAPTAARGASQADDARATCLAAYLSEETAGDGAATRAAMETIAKVAAQECGVPAAAIRMAGPPVNEAALSAGARQSLIWWGCLAVLASLVLAYFCFRDWTLALAAVSAAAFSAGAGLAAAFYYGAFETLVLERPAPAWGNIDAVMLLVPVAVYAISLAWAVFLVNYYLAARREFGVEGAAESAVRQGWRPSLAVAVATAAAIGSLAASDIAPPLRNYGVFAAAGVLAAMAILFAVVPALLHRFPGGADFSLQVAAGGREPHLTWSERVAALFIRCRGLTALTWAIALAAAGAGLLRLEFSGRPLALLEANRPWRSDVTWLERNVGGLMPADLVIAMPPERMRRADESAEQDGQQYRMTLLERAGLVRDVHRRITAAPGLSGAFSAATFLPAAAGDGGGQEAAADRNNRLEAHRDLLVDAGCLDMERSPRTGEATGRELWRLAVRAPLHEVDIAARVRRAADPLLRAYAQRDEVIRQLSARGKRLQGARLAVLFRGDAAGAMPSPDAPEAVLGQLLQRSGAADGGVDYVNIAALASDGAPIAADLPAETKQALSQYGAIIALAADESLAKRLAAAGLDLVDVRTSPIVAESAALNLVAVPGPRPIRAVTTGVAPLVERVHRETQHGLRTSLGWSAVLVAGVVLAVVCNPVGAVLAMVPIALPVAAILGVRGWMGAGVNMGVALAASVGLGVSLTSVIHYLFWFRRASGLGYGRRDAALIAHDRTAAAMVQVVLVVGLGLGVLALGGFSPMQQLGYLAPAMTSLALACQSSLLPALVAGPLGRWFGAVTEIRSQPATEEAATAPQPLNGELEAGRARPAAAIRIDAGGRGHAAPLDERREPAEDPHVNLQERLRRLRRRAGDSPNS